MKRHLLLIPMILATAAAIADAQMRLQDVHPLRTHFAKEAA